MRDSSSCSGFLMTSAHPIHRLPSIAERLLCSNAFVNAPSLIKECVAAMCCTCPTGGSYPGPFLCPEVIALMSDSLPDQVSGQQQQQQHAEPVAAPKADAVSAAEAQRLLVAAAAASRSEDGGSSRAAAAGGGGKAPKWLKMGK